MRIEIYHCSKYGNGAKVAEELQKLLTLRGDMANVHHIKDAKAKQLPVADLYIFGSPGRIGKPIGKMRRFLKKVDLPPHTRYAIFSTQGAARPNQKTGQMPSEEEMAKWQRILPIMDELLQAKDLTKVAESKFIVTNIKGPLEDGWQKKAEEFVANILTK
jgi:menaquinone-dependent protoporphyrinogen IX oxidase